MRVHVPSRSLECNEEKKERKKKGKIEPWIVMAEYEGRKETERKHNAADFTYTLTSDMLCSCVCSTTQYTNATEWKKFIPMFNIA